MVAPAILDELKSGLGALGANVGKLLRRHRRQDHFLLWNETDDCPSASTPAGEMRRPLAALLQLDRRARREPRAQPFARGKGFPNSRARRRDRNLKDERLFRLRLLDHFDRALLRKPPRRTPTSKTSSNLNLLHAS